MSYEELARLRRVEVAEICWHWDSAYEITMLSLDRYRAERRDGKRIMVADNPGDLWLCIRHDYTRCPVPRDL